MLLSWINIRRIMEFFSNANRACHPLNNVDSVSRQISSVQLYFFNLCLFIWLHQGLAVARRISAVSCVIFHCGTQALTSWSVLAWFFQGIWNLSSLTRNWTYVLCIGRQILNHWTTRKVPLCHSACWYATMSIYWGPRSSGIWLLCHIGPIWFFQSLKSEYVLWAVEMLLIFFMILIIA